MAGHEKLLEALVETGVLLAAERDLETLLQRIVENARAVFGAEGASIFVKEGEALRFAAFSNPVLEQRIAARGIQQHYHARRPPIGPGSIAGYTADSGQPLVISEPYALSPELPYKFDAGFDTAAGYRTHNIVSVPLATPHGGSVGVLQLVNLGDLAGFRGERLAVLKAFCAQAAVAVENAALIEQLEASRYEMIKRLAAAAEFRDKETGEHLERMSRYSVLVAAEMGWPPAQQKLLRYASPLHDVGKIAVPDSILLKPCRLTDDEWVIMRRHTVAGGEILKDGKDELTRMAWRIALHHHERYDGKGYPHGLAGAAVPEEARIVALADVYDALTSRRPYKEPFPPAKALAIIKEGAAGGQFAPEAAAALLALFEPASAAGENSR